MLIILYLMQVLKYLEDNVLPQGVRAVPLQGLEWLTTCVDCLAGGSVTIANSKTDYVFLTDKGFQMLQDLMSESDSGITMTMMQLILHEIVALFETKTTKSLGSGKCEGPVHQAVLEHLAVNSLARRSGERIPDRLKLVHTNVDTIFSLRMIIGSSSRYSSLLRRPEQMVVHPLCWP